jgi:hypothetical protein
MATYKILKYNGEEYALLKDGHTSIPFNPANTDYQAYLKWLEEGNTPEPAEGEQA